MNYQSPEGYSGQCFHDEGTEYVKINEETINENLFFCMKRPCVSVHN